MKNILVPIDFSEPSKSAALYAVALSETMNAQLTFFHVFHIPMITAEAAVVMPNYEDLEETSRTAMYHFVSELKIKSPVEQLVAPGFLIDELKEVVTKKKIDLVVMGINGVGKLAEILIGSNTTIAIHNLDCPILVIPEKVIYKPITNIAFACDFMKVQNSLAINYIKSVANTLNASVHILNIVSSEERPSSEKAIAGINLESIFQNINHTIYFPESDDITFAINQFVDSHAIDLLIMIPRKQSLLGSLFHRSNTKKMAFHTHVPLLTIHE
ncbi:MAG: universal stress protein [Bacteroidia bacterium]|nr:universal stress protein [Bacteroidia bacterium]